MDELECARNLRKYRDNPINPTGYDSDYDCLGWNDKEIEKFIATMNKAIKICERYHNLRKTK